MVLTVMDTDISYVVTTKVRGPWQYEKPTKRSRGYNATICNL